MDEVLERRVPKREIAARNYIESHGCSPDLLGYNILIKVILYAADYPDDTSRNLFERYAGDVGDKSPAGWRTHYKRARNCFLKSDMGDREKFFTFIKRGAAELVYGNEGKAVLS